MLENSLKLVNRKLSKSYTFVQIFRKFAQCKFKKRRAN